MNFTAKLLFVALTLATIPAAHAQLTWEKSQVELRPKLGEKSAVAHFAYENKGDKTVNIKNVRTSCGCTVASLKKNDVAPGEKGEITATFDIGSRTGVQQKIVTVESDDPEQPSVSLQMRVIIPQEITMQPQFVYWEMGEAPKPKTITVAAGEGVSMTKLDVSSSLPDFVTQVKKGSRSGEFLISVSPKTTERALTATLTIKPDYPRTLYASARVTPTGESTRKQ